MKIAYNVVFISLKILTSIRNILSFIGVQNRNFALFTFKDSLIKTEFTPRTNFLNKHYSKPQHVAHSKIGFRYL